MQKQKVNMLLSQVISKAASRQKACLILKRAPERACLDSIICHACLLRLIALSLSDDLGLTNVKNTKSFPQRDIAPLVSGIYHPLVKKSKSPDILGIIKSRDTGTKIITTIDLRMEPR